MDTRLLGAPWRELLILSATTDISRPYLIDPQGKFHLQDRFKRDCAQGSPLAAKALIHRLLAHAAFCTALCQIGWPLATVLAEPCAFRAKSLAEKT